MRSSPQSRTLSASRKSPAGGAGDFALASSSSARQPARRGLRGQPRRRGAPSTSSSTRTSTTSARTPAATARRRRRPRRGARRSRPSPRRLALSRRDPERSRAILRDPGRSYALGRDPGDPERGGAGRRREREQMQHICNRRRRLFGLRQDFAGGRGPQAKCKDSTSRSSARDERVLF